MIAGGGLVAMPTETVYGLAADATNDKAVARVFEAKARPQFNPLIIHVAGMDMASRYVEFSPLARRLAAEFWPGPLTMVLPRRKDSGLSLLVSAGLDTVAVRAPNHAIAQGLIKCAGLPLAAPSANKSGTISPTRPEHVAASLDDRVEMILDGGPCLVGVESTIVKIDGARVTILRPGGVARKELAHFLGKPVTDAPLTGRPEAPGMLASHYAPRALLRHNAMAPNVKEAYLAFGGAGANSPYTLNLSESGNLREAAANLFAYLRRLDDLCAEHGLSGIAAAPIPASGLGEAINDRLVRAAASRM